MLNVLDKGANSSLFWRDKRPSIWETSQHKRIQNTNNSPKKKRVLWSFFMLPVHLFEFQAMKIDVWCNQLLVLLECRPWCCRAGGCWHALRHPRSVEMQAWGEKPSTWKKGICYNSCLWIVILPVAYNCCHFCCLFIRCRSFWTEDKVWFDNCCEINRIKATTVLRRINTIIRHVMKADKVEKYDFGYQFSKCKTFNSIIRI